MRFQIATMALSLVMLSRQIQTRSVSAFQISGLSQVRSFTTKRFSNSGENSWRTSLNLSAVETETSGTSSEIDIENLFPQKGKDIMECAPRMRFAPSPTGR